MKSTLYDKVPWSQFVGRYIFFWCASVAFFKVATSVDIFGDAYVSFVKEVIGNFYSTGAVATWALMGLLYLPAFATACVIGVADDWFSRLVNKIAQWFESAVVEGIAIILGLGFVIGAPKSVEYAIAFLTVILFFMYYAFTVASGWFFNGNRRAGWISGYGLSILSIVVIAGRVWLGEKRLESIIDFAGYVSFSFFGLGIMAALWRRKHGLNKTPPPMPQ